MLVLVAGSNRVDETRIAQYVQEGIVKADADFVRRVTGFAIGGIPPLGHVENIRLIYIDRSLLEHEEVWAAAGTPHAVFCIKSNDLVRLNHGTVIDI